MKQSSTTKTIRITKDAEWEEVMADVLDGLRDGSIKNFILIAHRKFRTKKEQETHGGLYQFRKYWFGDGASCVKILGLLEFMKTEIINWIYQYGEDDWEEN